MTNVRRRKTLATLFLVVLLLSLPVAAAMQTVWLNSASRGEADRMRRNLSNAARQIRADFTFELASIATLLTPPVSESSDGDALDVEQLLKDFPEFFSAWRDQTRFPDLIQDVVYLGPAGGGIPHRFDAESGLFLPILEPYADWLAQTPALSAIDAPASWGSSLQSTLVLPLNPVVVGVPAADGTPLVDMLHAGELLVRLDEKYLSTVVAPALSSEYLGSDENEYRLAVVDIPAREVIWSNFDTTYDLATGPESVAADELVGLSPWPVLSFVTAEPFDRPAPESVAAEVRERFRGPIMQQWLGSRRGIEDVQGGASPGLLVRTEPAGLTLMIWHGAGGVEAAARTGRNRNLLLSYLALTVLAGAAAGYYALFLRANRQRERESEFVATVTHELRTPVAAIHAAADNLAEGIVTRPGQVREYGTVMLDEGRRLGTMIDQVLLYSGLQSGAPVPTPRHMDMEALVRRAYSQLPGLRQDHLVVRVQPNLTDIYGDPVATESVVRNLLSNAVKHNDESTTVWLTVGTTASNRKRRTNRLDLVIEVRDDGRGIPRRELPRVREPFFRGARSQADQVPGSGLGLSLVTRIADVYGGSVSIGSTLGQGTTVTVRLPLESVDEDDA